MKTFYSWLLTQTDRDDIVGDLAKDAKRDIRTSAGSPGDTKAEWIFHVGYVAEEAVKDAWQEYELDKAEESNL